jgi:Helix-turn-helix domain/Homeodomain-like domain
MRKEELEGYLAEGLSLEQIGKRVGRNPSTVSYQLRKHGLKPVNKGKHAARGPIPELKLRTLATEGKTVRTMARELDRSPSTVRHWLKRYGIEVHGIKGNREKALAARALGETVVRLRCRHHGETDFYVEPTNAHYKCKRCRKERVARRRNEVKDELIRMAGGKCLLCGYDRCLGALQFHHVDPETKSFGLSYKGHTKSFEKMLEEARKCVPLCANCHCEVERGMAIIPPGALRQVWGDDGTLRKRAA